MKISNFMELITVYGMKIGTALLVLAIGWFMVKGIVRVIEGVMKSNRMDIALQSFLKSSIDITLKIMLLVTVASMAGIQMTSFVALLGAAGLATGLAFQGSLSNFASGVLILIFRPFNIGDFVETQGNKGIVSEIEILYTSILTEDNKKIIIPNSSIYSNIIAVKSKVTN